MGEMMGKIGGICAVFLSEGSMSGILAIFFD